MCIRGVLRRRLKDLLLGLTPYGSLAARHDIGAVELVSHPLPPSGGFVGAYPTLRERLGDRLGVITAEPSLRVSGVAKDSLELLILLECKVELDTSQGGAHLVKRRFVGFDLTVCPGGVFVVAGVVVGGSREDTDKAVA